MMKPAAESRELAARVPSSTTARCGGFGRWLRARAPLFSLALLVLLGMHVFRARAARATSEREDPYFLLGQLTRVLGWIENEYVDPVDRGRLLEGAIEGMVAKLDPHSSYLPPEDYAIFQSDTEGKFGGVGVEVDFGVDYVTVIAPIEGSPAERAGVHPGDRIVAIDHVAVRGKSAAELVRRMRGAAGSKVLLTISRPGSDRFLYFSLAREVINVASVAQKLLTQNVGYLRIKAFQVGTHDELLEKLGELRKKAAPEPLRGVILDLRNNPGGLVNEASAVADEFLNDGVVFTTRRRGQIVDAVRAHAGGALQRGTVVALVNEYTASAAELLAAALQDNRRASIVGAPTFGKGSVQTIVDLPGGAGLRLTTLRYYSPLGRAIQADGIHPNVAVPSQGGDFGVVREKNIEGHLAPEQGGDATSPPVVSEPAASEPSNGEEEEAARLRQIPTDPRSGKDAALAVGYQLVIGALQSPPNE